MHVQGFSGNPSGAIGAPFLFMLAGLSAAPQGAAQQPGGVEEEIVVTGTRMRVADPTARIEVIDSNEIAARGLSSVEDVIRSIPQNFSTINSFTNLNFGFDTLDTNLGALGLGISTANLRGLGSGNTLVLVNGKRMAGVAGADEFFLNLRGLPIEAIERVEVHLDGGSYLYGSDAIGGVINIVLREEHDGAIAKVRREVTAHGSDGNLFSVYGGYSWGSGNLVASIERNEGGPTSNAETGYTTRDYSSLFGGDENYNFVGTGFPRSGAVGLGRWSTPNLILPPGNDGRNAQPEDFVAPKVPDDYYDLVPEEAGGATEDTSLYLSFRQEIGSRVTFNGEWKSSEAFSNQGISTYAFSAIPVPASNAFNNFGQTVYVTYSPITEIELGILNPPEQTSFSERQRYVVGFDVEVSEDWEFTLDYLKSTNNGRSDQYMFAPSRSSYPPDVIARLTELLASDDPDVALNLFGDGTGQNANISEFYNSFANSHDESHTQEVEYYLSGEPWQTPGGNVGFVIGGETRKEWLNNVGEPDFGFIDSRGVEKPTRDLNAAFIEILVPVIGANNARPGARQLTLTAQARYDEYETAGAKGRTDTGEPNVIETSFDAVSTRLGVAWTPMDNFNLRASVAESFRAPLFSQLFGLSEFSRFSPYVFDPLTGGFVSAILTYGPAPDLQPETSDNLTLGFDWSPQGPNGILIKVDWSRLDYKNRIASGSQLGNLLPAEVYGNLPQFFVRDDTGALIESISRYVNISRRINETVDLNVSYPFRTAGGQFVPSINYHRVLEHCDQAVPGADLFCFVGQSVGLDKYKIRGNLRWLSGKWAADLYVNYLPSYTNNDWENFAFGRTIPNTPVGSYTTLDLSGSYVTANGFTIRAGGRNVLDREFPFTITRDGRPFDGKRVDLRGRLLFAEISYEFDY